MGMEKQQVEWIWEYVLKHSASRRLARYLIEAFPIADDNFRLKKMVLLRSLSNQVSKGLISELLLEVLQGMIELSKSEARARRVADSKLGHREVVERLSGQDGDERAKVQHSVQEVLQGKEEQSSTRIGDSGEQGTKGTVRVRASSVQDAPVEKAMASSNLVTLPDSCKCSSESLCKELVLILKVELTLQHLRDGAKGWPAFLQALDKHWGDTVDNEKDVNGQNDSVVRARKQMKLDLWAIKGRPELQKEVITKYPRVSVETKLKQYLDLVWEEIGPTFLEQVENDVAKGMYKPVGALKLSEHAGSGFHDEDQSVKGKVEQGKPSIAKSNNALENGNVRQDIPELAVQVSHDMESNRVTETIVGDDITDHHKVHDLQDNMLVEEVTVTDEEEQTINLRERKKRIKTRVHTRNSREPASKKQKLKDVTSTPDAIARKRMLEKDEGNKGREEATSASAQEEYDRMVDMGDVVIHGSVSKKGETSDISCKGNQHSHQENVEEAQVKGDLDQGEAVEERDAQGAANGVPKSPSMQKPGDFPGHEEPYCLTPPPWAGSKSGVPSMRGSMDKRRAFRRGGNLEVSKAQQELKENQLHLKSVVSDPLPAAIEIAEALNDVNKRDIRHSPRLVAIKETALLQGKHTVPSVEGDQALQETLCRNDEAQPKPAEDHPLSRVDLRSSAKVSLMTRNATARTLEWEEEDEIEDDQAGSSPSDSKGVHLPKLRSRRISPLKQSSSSNIQAYRRKRQKWSKTEEDVLREGVERHGKGRWKLILQEHLDIFQDRTEVDLKDKWRNIERSEGILRDE